MWQAPRVRCAFRALATLAALLLFPAFAQAHGRFPEAGAIIFHPTDPQMIVARTSYGLLVTRDGGRLHARPMAPRAKKDEHAIYFLSDARSAKDHEIADTPEVAVTVIAGADYVAVSGNAHAIRDAALAAKLWTPFDKAFWNDANDPNIRVLARR